MEIKNRECEEVIIGKDKLYFLTNYKGKEYRKILDIQFGDSTRVGTDGKIDFNAGKLFTSLVDMFPIFCLDILRGEEHLSADGQYLDELEIKDYIKIQDIITNKVSEVINSKKA